ncbi:MAG: outer membrane protein and related peptidoglycan-associated protein [Alphaproteobacteria bacterium]|nr:outer membrane protein and related peptidoglycan-associated protein [Alphaproteobacteria bacterium]
MTLRNVLLAGVAAAALTSIAGAASAQVQTPGFFGSLEGWYILDSGNDKIYSQPSNLGAAPDDGFGGKAYLGYAFGSFDIAVGGQLSDLSKDVNRKGANGREVTVDGDVWAIDGEVGYTFRWSQTGLRLHLGARYAQFDHDRDWEWAGPDAINKQEWEGVGPRGGFDFAAGVGSGFTIFGGAAVSYLFGEIDSRYKPNAGGDIKRKINSDVWNVEGNIGVAYEVAPLVNIAAGYRAQYWDDVAHKNGSLNNGSIGGGVDRLMHGPFVRLSYNIGAPHAVRAIAAPVPPAPVVAPKKNYLVFFDFDRSNITADAQRVIEEAAAAAKAGNVARVQLTGHTDRSGSDQYNLALGTRRGEAVKQALIRLGIPAASIAVISRGESQPLVPTADGVREPQNRRVEIML